MKKITVCILIGCLLAAVLPAEVFAETPFAKKKPAGVMATAVNDKIAVSWEPLSGARGYAVYEKKQGSGGFSRVKTTKNTLCVRSGKERGETWQYYIKAYKKSGGKTRYSRASKKVRTTVAPKGVSTIKNFLKTGLAPMGSTMYIWGGGWNRADTAAGLTARKVGLTAKWRSFAKKQKKTYNYRRHRYRITYGLDCSGYVGFCVYNIMNTSNRKKGYVYSSADMAKKLSRMGFGTYRDRSEVKDYKAGDIMSSTCGCCRHVWIVTGQCSDGSVVLIHSSPDGVKLSGTPTPKGKKNSKAVRLARKYMKTYYPSWYRRFPDVTCQKQYLTHYSQMRWKEDVLSDPDGYGDMQADKVLKDLFK